MSPQKNNRSSLLMSVLLLSMFISTSVQPTSRQLSWPVLTGALITSCAATLTFLPGGIPQEDQTVARITADGIIRTRGLTKEQEKTVGKIEAALKTASEREPRLKGIPVIAVDTGGTASSHGSFITANPAMPTLSRATTWTIYHELGHELNGDWSWTKRILLSIMPIGIYAALSYLKRGGFLRQCLYSALGFNLTAFIKILYSRFIAEPRADTFACEMCLQTNDLASLQAAADNFRFGEERDKDIPPIAHPWSKSRREKVESYIKLLPKSNSKIQTPLNNLHSQTHLETY